MFEIESVWLMLQSVAAIFALLLLRVLFKNRSKEKGIPTVDPEQELVRISTKAHVKRTDVVAPRIDTSLPLYEVAEVEISEEEAAAYGFVPGSTETATRDDREVVYSGFAESGLRAK